MNQSHINKYWGNKILEWCKTNMGKSKYRRGYPKLKISKRELDGGEYFKFLWAKYEDGRIIVCSSRHKSFIKFAQTIIHEYTHFQQNIEKYHKFNDKYGYEKNPMEKEARKNERKYGKKCVRDLRKSFLKKVG